MGAIPHVAKPIRRTAKGIRRRPHIRICADSVVTAIPILISIYSIAGAKFSETYGTSMDCSSLRGHYLVKAWTRVAKAIF